MIQQHSHLIQGQRWATSRPQGPLMSPLLSVTYQPLPDLLILQLIFWKAVFARSSFHRVLSTLIQTMLYFCNKNVQWSACLVKENWHHRNGCSTAKSEADTEAERNRKSLNFPPSNLNYIGIKRGQASNNFEYTNIKNLNMAFLLFCDPHSINHIRKTHNNQLRYALSWNQ